MKYYNLNRLAPKIGEWVIALILLYYPIFASISVYLGINSTPISVSYRFLYLLLSVFILLIFFLQKEKRKLNLSLFFITTFWLFYLFRLLYDFYIVELNEGYARKGFFFYFQYGILGSFLPSLALGTIAKEINMTSLLKILKWSAFISLLSILFIIYREIGFGLDMLSKRSGLGEDGAVFNPIILSQYGGILFFIFFYDLLYGSKKIINIIGILLSTLVILLGASRGPMLAIVIGITLIIVMQFWKKFNSAKYWLSIIMITPILLYLANKIVIPNLDNISIFNRIANNQNNQDLGGEARSLQWRSAWNQFIENPILGDQIIEKVFNYYPHNFILEILMSLGLIGIIPMIPLLFKSIVNFNYLDKHYLFHLLLIVFTIYSLFSLSLITIPQFWILLVLTTSIKKLNIKTAKFDA